MLKDICICFSRKCHLSQTKKGSDSSEITADPTRAQLCSAPVGFTLSVPWHVVGLTYAELATSRKITFAFLCIQPVTGYTVNLLLKLVIFLDGCFLCEH